MSSQYCSTDTRGQASLDRSEMETHNIQNGSDYSAYSGSIHCQNGNTDNCSNADAVAPILGKYTQ
jgi:hypothetical protein